MRSSHSGYVPAFRRRVGFVINHPGWPQGRSVIPVDVRVVAATNVDLRDEVAAGRFRSDLFFRLNVLPITLPPLKDRRDDISLLMEAFLRRYCEQHLRHVPGFTPRAVQALLQYDIPGHIRELQNLVERGVIMALHDEPIGVHHLFRGGEHMSIVSLGLDPGGRLAEALGVAPELPFRVEKGGWSRFGRQQTDDANASSDPSRLRNAAKTPPKRPAKSDERAWIAYAPAISPTPCARDVLREG